MHTLFLMQKQDIDSSIMDYGIMAISNQNRLIPIIKWGEA